MAENNGGYKAVNFGYTDERVYSKLTSDNPIDLVRYHWRTATWDVPD
jgi:class I fructose-bisphosphate aldolase